MNRPDVEEFEALWQGGVDPEEQATLEAMARVARRRGRFLAYADTALAILIVGGSIFGALIARGPVMMAAAVLVLIVTLWLTWRRRTLRQMAATLNTSDRQAFIESSIRNAYANLRRNTLSLAVFPFVVPAALTWKVSRRYEGEIPHPLTVVSEWGQSTRGMITLFLMSLLVIFMIRSRQKIKSELRRLQELRRVYEDEAEREEAAGSEL